MNCVTSFNYALDQLEESAPIFGGRVFVSAIVAIRYAMSKVDRGNPLCIVTSGECLSVISLSQAQAEALKPLEIFYRIN